MSCRDLGRRPRARRPASRRTRPGRSALRLDRPHLPPPQAPRQLALLRRQQAASPTASAGAMLCKAVPQSAKTPGHLEPAPLVHDRQAGSPTRQRAAARVVLRAARAGTLPAVSWISPSQACQRAPASAVEHRAGLRHRPDQHDHAEPRLELDRDLPHVGRLGRLLRPCGAAACGRIGYGLRVPALVISPYAEAGYIDHQTLSFDAYLKFIEDDFLGGARINPKTDGRPDGRPNIRENAKILGNLSRDFRLLAAAASRR